MTPCELCRYQRFREACCLRQCSGSRWVDCHESVASELFRDIYTSALTCTVSYHGRREPLLTPSLSTDHGEEFYFRSWQIVSELRNSPYSAEPEGSLLQLQVSATCPCPEPDHSRPFLFPTYLRSILILSFLLVLGLWKWSPSLMLPRHNPYFTSPHSIRLYRIVSEQMELFIISA